MTRADYDELDSPDGETYYWLDSPDGVTCYSQEQLFTGVAYQMRPEGQLWTEEEFLDGRRHGQSRSWYPSGQIEEEATYYSSRLYGPARNWDEAGRLRREAFIEYGLRVREKKWDEDGRLTEDYEMPPNHPNYSSLQKFRAAYGADPRFGPVSKEPPRGTSEGD